MAIRISYNCAAVVPKAQEKPFAHPRYGKGRVPVTRAYVLARAIDKYYLNCVNKIDLWGDPLVVAKMIEEVYGEEETNG